MKDTHSPINQVPLHNPGESLSWKRMQIFDGIEMLMMLTAVMGIFTAWEWVRWFREIPPNPIGSSILFGILCVVVVMRIARNIRSLKNYSLGLMGERHVAEMLEELKVHGYYVIHDVSCGRMNIDHVLVGPGGIFTIETKMARKKPGEFGEIVHSDKGVFMNGKSGWCSKALWEAEKETEYLHGILTQTGDGNVRIQPIVVYPGWFVKDDCRRNVWVLNDRYLVKKIRALPTVLSLEKVQALRHAIEKYVREKTKETDFAG